MKTLQYRLKCDERKKYSNQSNPGSVSYQFFMFFDVFVQKGYCNTKIVARNDVLKLFCIRSS